MNLPDIDFEVERGLAEINYVSFFLFTIYTPNCNNVVI